MKERGSISIIILVMATVLLLFGSLVSNVSRTELAIAKEEEEGMAARYLAEAGITYACRLLEVREAEQMLPNRLNNLSLAGSAGVFSLEIKMNCKKLPDDREIRQPNQHWIKSSAAMPSGALRVVEVAVQETQSEAGRTISILSQWEH